MLVQDCHGRNTDDFAKCEDELWKYLPKLVLQTADVHESSLFQGIVYLQDCFHSSYIITGHNGCFQIRTQTQQRNDHWAEISTDVDPNGKILVIIFCSNPTFPRLLLDIILNRYDAA